LYSLSKEQIVFQSLAEIIWDSTRDAKSASLQWGEETITELLLLELFRKLPHQVKSRPFNKREEAKTGADWLWVLTNPDMSRSVSFLVQAKVLEKTEIKYASLYKETGKHPNKRLQLDVLIDCGQKIGAHPIYAFYNHVSLESRIPRICHTYSKREPVESWGISISNAHSVDQQKVDNKFDTHVVRSIPFHCLLCTNGDGEYDPDFPTVVALSADRLLGGKGSIAPDDGIPKPIKELLRQAGLLGEGSEFAREPVMPVSEEYPNLAGIVLIKAE